MSNADISTLRNVLRASLVAGVIALLAALPVALGPVPGTDFFQRTSVQASTDETLVTSSQRMLMSSLPLFLDRGILEGHNAYDAKRRPGSGRLVLRHATLSVPSRTFIVDASKGAVSLGTQSPQEPLAPLLKRLARLDFKTLRLEGCAFHLVGPDGSTTRLSEIDAEVTSHGKGSIYAAGSGVFQGRSLRFEASWSPDTQERANVAKPVFRAKLSVRASNLEANFEGLLHAYDSPKFVGAADLRARRLRSLARWFGLAVPEINDLTDARIVGPIELSDGRLAFPNAVVDVSGNHAEGALLLKIRGPRPAIEGTLAFRTFDLRPFIAAQLTYPPLLKRNDDAASATDGGSLSSAFDADLRLSAGKVTMPHLETGRGAVTINLRSGRMLADLAELELESGTASGQIMLDVNTKPASLKLKGDLKGFDPGRALAELLNRNPLLGRADLSIEAGGRGTSLTDIIASAGGHALLTLPKGGKLGLDLNALAYSAKQEKHIGWRAAGKGATTLDTLTGRFHFSNGALSIKELRALSSGTQIVVGGQVDLRDHVLDLNVALSPVDPAATHVDRSEIAFRGKWDDPAISLMGRPFTTPLPSAKGLIVPGAIAPQGASD